MAPECQLFGERDLGDVAAWSESRRYSSAAEMWNGSACWPPTGSTIRSVGNWHRSKPLAPGNAVRYILNQMVQYSKAAQLDAAFAALSDATRRGVLDQLGRADASITDLAKRFDMTLTGMKKHVGVLEHAGLVATAKVGRVRTCTLGQRRLDEVTAWIDRYRQLWSARFDELDQVIEELKQK